MNEKQETRRGRERSVYRFIVLPLLGLLVLEIALLLGGIYGSGVVDRLRQNSGEMLAQQVENRYNYLENTVAGIRTGMAELQVRLNDTAAEMAAAGTLDLDGLRNGGAGTGGGVYLKEITPDLIQTLYARRASGMYVILNTEDLSGYTDQSALSFSGICIRDMDPFATQPRHNEDLLLTRAPVSVVRGLGLSTDVGWSPQYRFDPGAERDYFTKPFQAAYSLGSDVTAQHCGYWSAAAYTLQDSTVESLSYSQPLILADGTVYGVVGIEVQVKHMKALLPFGELFADDLGSYILAFGSDGSYTPVLASGMLDGEALPTLELDLSKKLNTVTINGAAYAASVQELSLYDNNAPLAEEDWLLIGTVREDDLYAFADNVMLAIQMITLAIFALGVLGSVLVSRRLTDPIRQLAAQVAEAREKQDGVPDLAATGIREIDQFSSAIVDLSRSAMESSTRFLRIIDMASIGLGGFEYHDDEDYMFVTDNFFPLLGLHDVDTAKMDRARFGRQLERLQPCLVPRSEEKNARLYKISGEDGSVRYVRVGVRREGGCVAGLAEDVTVSTKERLRIERERDFDMLTGIYNRRACCRMVEELFSRPEQLGTAALMMIDLDDLKALNDSFGHDMGDLYIRRAGQCFQNAAPEGTVVARLSGDEFYLFFYGYQTRREIRGIVDQILEAARRESVQLPNGKRRRLSFSGGVAWYPKDSTDMHILMKYADFAMYQVKHTRKNGVAEFNLRNYQREYNSSQYRREFQEILENRALTYHFQPIVELRTGKIWAYEALMRADMPLLKNPEEILETARKENRLGDLEVLTWFKAAETYQSLLERQEIAPDAMLFINSIANQRMPAEKEAEFHRRFGAFQARIVLEIMEADQMDHACTNAKRLAEGFSGLVALDDYGSGYNSEKNLLELNPAFTKVDISIIRNIHDSPDKQEIVSNMVSYAHQRGMRVIAEGVEMPQELETVIKLGVDMAQGYFLGRPTAAPAREITPEAQKVISGMAGQ